MQSITAHQFRQVLEGGPIPPQWSHAIKRHTVSGSSEDNPAGGCIRGTEKCSLEERQRRATAAKKASAEKTRAAVLKQLKLGLWHAEDIAAEIEITGETTRQHLYALEKDGLVTGQRRSNRSTIWRLS